MRRYALLAALIALYLTPTYAQPNPTAEVCNAVLQQGITDNYDLYSNQRLFNNYQDRLCNIEYDSYESFRQKSSSIGLDIPIKKVVLGFDFDQASGSEQFRERYSQFCSSNYATYDRRAEFDASISRVNANLVRGWERCVQHMSDRARDREGVVIAATPQPDYRQFTIKVWHSDNQQESVVVRNINPRRGVTCFHGTDEINPGEDDAVFDFENFSMTCTKPVEEGVTFSLDTQGGTSNNVYIPPMENRLDLLESQIEAMKDAIVPAGTVAAFNLDSCPSPGWNPFQEGAGRVIVGTGQSEGGTSRSRGDTGGSETVTLTESQMPRHRHQNPTEGHNQPAREVWALRASNQGDYGGAHARPTQETGGGQPHPNMPPFVALTLCEKN